AARRAVIPVDIVRLARVWRTLGSEGERYQQRPYGAGVQATVVGADPVGGGAAEHKSRTAGWEDARRERGHLLLLCGDRGRKRPELGTGSSGAVHRAPPRRPRLGAQRGTGDNVAAGGSASA